MVITKLTDMQDVAMLICWVREEEVVKWGITVHTRFRTLSIKECTFGASSSVTRFYPKL